VSHEVVFQRSKFDTVKLS